MTGRIVWLAVAGALGTLARYGLGGAVHGLAGARFPFGTLAVNAAGCLGFGLVWALAEERFAMSPEARSVLLIGFFGGFTTFSSFAFETMQMLRDGEWLKAGANVAFQNALGIAMLWLGVTIGRAVAAGGAA